MPSGQNYLHLFNYLYRSRNVTVIIYNIRNYDDTYEVSPFFPGKQAENEAMAFNHYIQEGSF
jgi:hypothetical protein